MSSNEKESKSGSVVKNKYNQDNQCPIKEDDNCKVPGVYSDSATIGGA